MKIYQAIQVFLIAQLLFTNGCAFVSHGRIGKITQDKVKDIRIGVSTKDDIIEEFGKPQRIAYKPGGKKIFVYSHGLEKRVMIPFFISIGRTGGAGQSLKVIFHEDVVVDYEFVVDQRALTK